MTLDVFEIDRVGNAWVLIKVHQITLQIWVVDDAAQIALEMAVINDVESDECAEKSPIGFDDAGSWCAAVAACGVRRVGLPRALHTAAPSSCPDSAS